MLAEFSQEAILNSRFCACAINIAEIALNATKSQNFNHFIRNPGHCELSWLQISEHSQVLQWRIQRGVRGPWPPYKPMSGRLTSCSRRKDKRIMVSSHKELNVANA